MNTVAYYLWHVVPIVLCLAAIFFVVGLLVGRLIWGSLPRKTFRLEDENHRLRVEIKRLNGTY